jgi:hypothetical protein
MHSDQNAKGNCFKVFLYNLTHLSEAHKLTNRKGFIVLSEIGVTVYTCTEMFIIKRKHLNIRGTLMERFILMEITFLPAS